MMKLLTLTVLAVASAPPVLACDFCSIYSATEAQGGEQGFYSTITEQFTHFGTVKEDGQELPNDADQFLDSSITQLIVGYNVDKRFGVQLNIPYIDRTFRRPHGTEIESGNVSGLGDLALSAHYIAYKKL